MIDYPSAGVFHLGARPGSGDPCPGTTDPPPGGKLAASRVSVMTVKTSDTCSSRRRSQLVCKRMPGADKPVRARQRVLAGVGAQP